MVTRREIEEQALAFLEPVLARLDTSGARVSGLREWRKDPPRAHLEAFARSLWACMAVSRGGGTIAIWDLLRSGLAAGTNPNHSDYWGEPKEFDQRIVEMASISAALLLVPEHLWQPMSAAEQRRVLDWLGHVDTRAVYNNNWRFFRVVNDLARRSLGGSIDEKRHRQDLDDLCSRMLADGWWNDGGVKSDHQIVDWYSVFVFHSLAIVYATSGVGDPEISQRYLDHAQTFAEQHKQWFASDGTPLAYGRSMTYRMAQSAFWAMLPLANLEALPWGQVKSLYLRSLSTWMKRPIFDCDGVLSVGYWNSNPEIAERYISSGSPYWASIAFMALAVPEDHPFWTSKETQPDIDRGPVVQAAPGFVLSSDGQSVQALSSGRAAEAKKRMSNGRYGKLAYSTHFPFSLETPSSLRRPATDSTLAFRLLGRWRFASTFDSSTIVDGVVMRRCALPQGVVVETAMWGEAPWHLRLHTVRTTRRLGIAEFGFALPLSEADSAITEIDQSIARVRSQYGCVAVIALDGNGLPKVDIVPAKRSLAGVDCPVPFIERVLPPGTHRVAIGVLASLADQSTWVSDVHTAWESHADRLGALMDSVFGTAQTSSGRGSSLQG